MNQKLALIALVIVIAVSIVLLFSIKGKKNGGSTSQLQDFLPQGAELLQKLELDLDADGKDELILAYARVVDEYRDAPGATTSKKEYKGGVVVLKRKSAGFEVVFEDRESGGAFESNVVDIKRINSSGGKVGLFVRELWSLNAPSSGFYIVISLGGRFTKLDEDKLAQELFRKKGAYITRTDTESQFENDNVIVQRLFGFKENGNPYMTVVRYRYSGTTLEVVNTEDSGDMQLKDINNKVLVGSYIENKFSDTAYANLVAKEFSAGQSLWYAAWGGWPSQDSFNFADFNAVVNWLRQNGKSAHMHMLVGPNSYMPQWLINGTWTNGQLDALLKNMIYSIMDANDNKNKVDVWNVVNESLYDDGSYVADADVIWYRLGWETDQSGLSGVDKINARHPVFIRKAFQYARDKTNAKLEYRDFHIESNNPTSGLDKKHKAVYQLLKHMLNSGIPVDAVGIQGHLDIGNVNGFTENNDLQNTVQKFKALGLEVYITEMDIGTAGQTWNDALAIQQKTDYYNYLRQAINGGASRIYVWGIADSSDPTWRTNEHPLPWDRNYGRKPAYDGIVQALEETR